MLARAFPGAIFLLACAAPAFAADDLAAERRVMIDDIKKLALSAGAETGRPELDPRVLDAMSAVPRHDFVPPAQSRAAYKNRPLPIGHGQTISQPYIVALMTDLLQLDPGDNVLEVGTGSGYQAAVLSKLATKVHTIEIVEPLGREAAATLQRLGYRNVETRIGDGYQGWPEHAPYDAIIVTAAPDHIPPALVAQLRPGGRLVIPVGGLNQELLVVEKRPDGTTVNRDIVPVRFVPLTRDRGTEK